MWKNLQLLTCVYTNELDVYSSKDMCLKVNVLKRKKILTKAILYKSVKVRISVAIKLLVSFNIKNALIRLSKFKNC